jgi:hypothetical protein
MGSLDVRPAQEVTHEDRHQVRGRRARRRRPADELGKGERDGNPKRDDERVLEDWAQERGSVRINMSPAEAGTTDLGR